MPGIRRCGSFLHQHGIECTDEELGRLMEILHDLACRSVDKAVTELRNERHQRGDLQDPRADGK